MPDPAPDPLAPDPAMPAASMIAHGLGRVVLRAMRWPGRRWAGSPGRRRSRVRGGRRFKAIGTDGVTLDAWFSPSDPGSEPRIPVVFCHGWLEFKEVHFPLADRLNRRGHDVIIYDHRGHGHSSRSAATFGVKERLDLRHVIDTAQRRNLLGEQVATIGFSLGAATVLQHAPDDHRVAGVVAIAPFVDFRSAIGSFREKLAPWMSHQWLMRGFESATREAGFELDEASTVRAIGRIDVPVLIVEGSRDSALPPLDHVRPLEAAKQRGDLKILAVDGAGHGSLMHRRWPGLNETVDEFLDSLPYRRPAAT